MTNNNAANPYQAPSSDIRQGTARKYQPKIFSVQGRIGRLRYLAYSMLNFVIFIPIMFVGGILGGVAGATGAAETGGLLMAIYMLVAYLAAFVYSFVLMKRRFNDMDKTGWFSLLSFIPLVNFFVFLWLIFGRGTNGVNTFGAEPIKNSLVVKIVGLTLPIIVVIGFFAAIFIPAYQDYVKRAEAQAIEYRD